MTATRETLVGCRYCTHLTSNADKVCDGPSCRRIHGHPIYAPTVPVFPETPGRAIITVGGGR